MGEVDGRFDFSTFTAFEPVSNDGACGGYRIDAAAMYQDLRLTILYHMLLRGSKEGEHSEKL